MFWARNGLGDILVQRNDLSGALRSFRNGLAVMDELAKSDPGNVGWQRDLAVSFERIGTAQIMQNDPPGALASFRDGLAIVEKLAGSESRQCRRAARSGVVFHQARRRAAGASRSGRRAQKLSGTTCHLDRLAKSDPGNVMWQRDLSGRSSASAAPARQNDLSGALKNYRNGFTSRTNWRFHPAMPAPSAIAVAVRRHRRCAEAQADMVGALRRTWTAFRSPTGL